MGNIDESIMYSDEDILDILNGLGFKIDEYYLQETKNGDYAIFALSGGQYYDFFWENDISYQATLDFLKRNGARTLSWSEYVKSFNKK